MAVLLALGSAVTFGVADFLGGMASRRARAWSVVVGSQLCGGLVLVAALPVLPPATVTGADLLWGAAAGIAGAIGLTQFFRALAIGHMSIAAPVSAVITGGVPVIAGVAMGERPGVVAWLGISLALPAIALISRTADGDEGAAPPGLLLAAVVAGMGFGAFFVLVDRTGDAAGIHPLIAARATSVCVIGAAGFATGRLGPVRGRLLAVVALSGALDMGANVLFLYAVREGLLALGSVISAMYPASTLVLARVVLGERLRTVQQAGLALAGVAIALVALA